LIGRPLEKATVKTVWHSESSGNYDVTISYQQPVSFKSLDEQLAGALFLPEGGGPFPAMIVCHGAGEFKENYAELCNCLAERGVAALAIDMHGHGDSGGERFNVNMDEWVADVCAALEFLARHPKVRQDSIGAFGLSSGGTAILEAALIEPRLRALVALDATVRNSMPWSYSLLLKGLILLGKVKKQFTNRDLRLCMLGMLNGIRMASDPEIEKKLRANPKSVAAFRDFPLPGAAHSVFVNTLEKVSRIKIPTLVLWGEEDELDPPETARLLYNALMCKKQLHIIPGNGHVGHLDKNREQVFALTANWALENLA
jgi:alpha-beta hydrolase superfamily lysophospholipase